MGDDEVDHRCGIDQAVGMMAAIRLHDRLDPPAQRSISFLDNHDVFLDGDHLAIRLGKRHAMRNPNVRVPRAEIVLATFTKPRKAPPFSFGSLRVVAVSAES